MLRASVCVAGTIKLVTVALCLSLALHHQPLVGLIPVKGIIHHGHDKLQKPTYWEKRSGVRMCLRQANLDFRKRKTSQAAAEVLEWFVLSVTRAPGTLSTPEPDG